MVQAVEFKAALKRWQTQKMEPAIAGFQRELAIELGRRVVKRTPVKTGQARANTRLAIGNRVGQQFLRITDKIGDVTIQKITQSAQRIAPYSNWTIYNAVPYAQRLEHGWSRQAPSGMFRISVKEVVALRKQMQQKALNKLGRFVVN